MKFGHLANLFEGISVKTLSMVDATPSGSNQHEIGTTRSMRTGFLGEERHVFNVAYLFLAENEEAISAEGTATHYDTRENAPHRSPEWRLYYQGNVVTELMSAGDTLFLAKRSHQNLLLFIVAPRGSTIETQLLWLFGLQRATDRFSAADAASLTTEIGFAGQFILDELGIEPELDEADQLDNIISQFEGHFPSTRVFSSIARETCPATDPVSDPDHALTTWLAHEEAMFRRLELAFVRKRLQSGFREGDEVDVDGFLSFSLSVQNRRKSRMGQSFEHHLAATLDQHSIRYERGATTEQNQKPDFLLPDYETYAASRTGDMRLMMLAAKSTCKDRWRQILAEADKIPKKHLATLEPAISASQTDQMSAYGVELVVPSSIQASYSDAQRETIWSLADFIREARTRQTQE